MTLCVNPRPAMTDFSAKASEQLFARFPEWRQYAKSEAEADGKPFVRLDVPAPTGANAHCGLVISTANGEVTIEFDYYHSHFDDMVGNGTNVGTEAALDLIAQLLAEKVAAVSWWHGEDWRGSTLIEAGEKPKLDDFTGPFNRIRIRSWKGTLNADVDA